MARRGDSDSLETLGAQALAQRSLGASRARLTRALRSRPAHSFTSALRV